MTAASQALIALPQASDGDIRPLVEAELARIMVHASFIDTTRMKRFLNYVVTEALAGREDRLKGYSIGLEVFDRPDDFDPQADTIVRVQAGQLRRRLDLYYASDGKNSPVRILIPKGRYSPVFEIRCEAPELGEDGKKGAIVNIEKQNRPGIAVLTFQNLSSDEEAEYFAEGVTAEIVNALVQFRYMRIVARSASVIEDKSMSSDLSAIAEKFNVQFALTGNVRRAGNLMRVSVNLISVETGEHVYSKIFDRQYTPENLFEIQEEIASYVAASVAAPFGAVNRYNRRDKSGRTSSLPAYEAVLKYYDMNITPSLSKAVPLLAEFEKITRDTPRFSSAWAIVALLNVFLVQQRVPSLDAEHRLSVALHAAKRAVEIDPENALAFSALYQANYHSGHLDIAEDMAAKAIMLNPNNYNMLAYYAATRAFRGDAEGAAAYQKAALDLVARPPAWFYTSTLINDFHKGEFERVFAALEKETMTPDSVVIVQSLGLSCMGHLSKTAEAKAFITAALKKDPDYAQNLLATVKHAYLVTPLLNLIKEGWRKAGLDIAR